VAVAVDTAASAATTAPGRAAARRPAGAQAASRRAQRAGLGKNADNVSDGRWEAKRRRYETRAELWRLSSLERVRKCGRTSRLPSGQVGMRLNGDRSGYAGLTTCGSPWACPVCAAKVAAGRAADLDEVFGWAVDQGHTVALLTLTMRHHAGQSLKACWDAATAAWRRVTSGGGWIGLTARYEVLGFARGLEVLHGANGWHVHVHVPLILDGAVSEARIRLLGEAMYDRWHRGLASKGFTAIRDAGGLDIRRAYGPEDLSGYLVKGLSLEVTHGHIKSGRGTTELRAPFQLFADFLATGDTADLALWREWETISHNRKQLTWSVGLRELAGLAVRERTDEEIAEDDSGGESQLIFDPPAWRVIAPIQAEVLEVGGRQGLRSLIAWLDARGIAYIVTPAGRRLLEGP